MIEALDIGADLAACPVKRRSFSEIPVAMETANASIDKEIPSRMISIRLITTLSP